MNSQSRAYLAGIVLLAGCAADPVRVPVPASLVPAGEREVERLAARGTQTYECRAKPGSASTAGWVYVAANLDLIAPSGEAVGRHTFAPAIWEASDGSKLAGEIRARVNAPLASNGQWLLVSSRSVGKHGRFSTITSLQRLDTHGGVAPADGCDPTKLGIKTLVPFTAQFVLFTR